MNQVSLVDSFEKLQGADIPNRDDYLDKIIIKMGDDAVVFLRDNLIKGIFIEDSISICGRLGINELIPHISQYLNVENEDIQIIVAIALTKLQNEFGVIKLREMYSQGLIPDHWLLNEGISIESIS